MVSRNVLGLSIAPNMYRIMGHGGHYASIMRADKKKKDESGLPSGIPIPCLPVSYLKEKPSFWVDSDGSYVCPVDADWGLWFDWRMNNSSNTAVLTSVKGLNPISGQRIEGLGLEQYKEKCPIHDVSFKHGRLCEACGFKWPEQNYLSKPMPFYLDGFRTSDGKVRQFYFTEDMAKSIPELVIGRDDTVPAFGFCFYNLKDMKTDYEGGNRLKNKKAEKYFKDRSKPSEGYSRIWGASLTKLGKFSGTSGASGFSGISGPPGTRGTSSGRIKLEGGTTDSYGAATYTCANSSMVYNSSMALNCSSDNILFKDKLDDGSTMFSNSISTGTVDLGITAHENPLKYRVSAEVGIGAGEEIDQELSGDKRLIDSWQKKPSGIIRVYFVFQEEFERYAEAGFNDLHGEKEGFLAECPVGVAHE